MERKFSGGGQQGGYAAGVNTTPATTLGVDEAYLHGYFSELSFQSILQPLCPYIDVGVGGSSESPGFSPATYSYFTPEPPTTYQFLNPEAEIKMTKHEVLNTQDFAFQLLKLNETPPNAAVSPPEALINFFSTDVTDHLPPLRSLEPKKTDAGDDDVTAGADHLLVYQTGSLSDIMNVRVQKLTESSPSSAPPTHRVDSVVPSPSPSSSSSLWTKYRNHYMPYKSSALARQRRQRISEKTRCLQRLLPWDKKMDMGTMLEEAYKYVKFLQAQISILENMPVKNHPIGWCGGGDVGSSSNVGGGSGNDNDGVLGELGKLSRQQLLEVVVNSPVAQTVLYSRGCCVYSMEQLVLLNKNAHNNALSEQLLLASPLLFY